MANINDASRKPETFHLTPEAQNALPQQAQIALQQVDNLKYFLISAPVDWAPDQYIRRFLLPTAEYVSCVLWGNLFHMTGTDIVRCLAFRFHAFGRPVKNSKKFEEGIFSDLRNLKAGTDASLEEPKSPFLDFLYKNNCIRTQKKQKVFYWYSVPHDRLFLDALERDLKRERAGQEPTTESVSEPSLSFVYDPTRSLYEQLTRPEDQVDDGEQGAASDAHSRSPSAVRAASSAPPAHQTVSSVNDYLSGDVVNDDLSYSQQQYLPSSTTQMIANHLSATVDKRQPSMMATTTMNRISTGTMKIDQMYDQMSYGPVNNNGIARFDSGQLVREHRHSIPQDSHSVRQTSLPSYYLEPSPAPSFVSASSYYDDNSRAVSYDPVTPPQYNQAYSAHASFSSEDPTYLNDAYDVQQSYNAAVDAYAMSMPPPPPRFSSVPRRFPSSNVQYNHIEGSPHYKQRRRTNSLAAGYPIPTGQPTQQSPISSTRVSPYTVRRPSDLRRSVSASVVPQIPGYERSASGPPGSTAYMNDLRQTPGTSRQSSPLASIENHNPAYMSRPRYASLASEHSVSTTTSNGTGVVRRARSNTTDVAPYPQRSHTCPIPTCGRTFKRLEHLKRHVRTHTQEKPYQCNLCDKAFSRSDNLAQHRRTHEPQSDSVDDEADEEGSDSCAGLTEDVDSPESVTYTAAPISMSMAAGSALGDLTMPHLNKAQAFPDVSGSFYDQDYMGVPPLMMNNQAFAFN